tara:strand:+ start:3586 stop:4008 length:423 start_codon:yes stop_codon:yes gene_type:complete
MIVGLMLSLPQTVFAHCQVPCGIYDDYARVKGMMEDAATVKKSVKLLNELAGKTDVQSQQQFVRWVNTKEMHAQKVISTIADYFLTQRVKASQEDYVERLTKHHAVIVAAMKAKQNATMEAAEALEKAIMALEGYYPHEH